MANKFIFFFFVLVKSMSSRLLVLVLYIRLVRPLHTAQVALTSGRCYLLQYAGITSAGRERAS